jgi:hypothetical protein
MSLNFGFNMYDHTPVARKDADERFAALSEKDKDFYHNDLPWLMIAAGMNRLTKKNIRRFVNRSLTAGFESLLGIPEYEGLPPKDVVEDIVQYMEKFIDYDVNVSEETELEWLKKTVYKKLNLWGQVNTKTLYRKILHIDPNTEV